MPIKILWEDSLYCPVVVCDWCGERIDDVGLGLYSWLPVDDDDDHDFHEMFFLHKRVCCPAFEAAHPVLSPKKWFWDELRKLPARLAVNVDWSRDPRNPKAVDPRDHPRVDSFGEKYDTE